MSPRSNLFLQTHSPSKLFPLKFNRNSCASEINSFGITPAAQHDPCEGDEGGVQQTHGVAFYSTPPELLTYTQSSSELCALTPPSPPPRETVI